MQSLLLSKLLFLTLHSSDGIALSALELANVHTVIISSDAELIIDQYLIFFNSAASVKIPVMTPHVWGSKTPFVVVILLNMTLATRSPTCV